MRVTSLGRRLLCPANRRRFLCASLPGTKIQNLRLPHRGEKRVFAVFKEINLLCVVQKRGDIGSGKPLGALPRRSFTRRGATVPDDQRRPVARGEKRAARAVKRDKGKKPFEPPRGGDARRFKGPPLRR